jgi:galactokinase
VEPLDFPEFERQIGARVPELFAPGRPVTVARAPGRLDVMGGVADYSGSVVLELPLGAGTFCALQWRADDQIRVVSDAATAGGAGEVTLPLAELQPGGEPLTYEAARARLAADPATRWAAYVLGAFVVLHRELGLPPWTRGASLLLTSDLPLGAGVASSASVEVAAMSALAAAAGLPLAGDELARLCQIVENRVVGAPCGIMDQVTCALGRAGKLLALRCQPAELLGHDPVPPGVAFFGISSGVKHSVGGGRYTRARCAAFMGLGMIAADVGESGRQRPGTGPAAPRPPSPGPAPGRRSPGEDPPYGGYLCNIGRLQFYHVWRPFLPPEIRGAEYLHRYGPTSDTVTQVDPDQVYPVRGAVEHAVYENYRAQEFRRLLERAPNDSSALDRAGRLMYASHWSYGNCIGLGAPETDLLVRLARRAGVRAGIYGAKITGGGSGGTVAVLAREDARGVVEEIAAEYARQTGRAPRLLEGSSPGAVPFGSRTVTPVG